MNRSRDSICWCAAAIFAGGLGFAAARLAPHTGREVIRPPVEAGFASKPDGSSSLTPAEKAAAPVDLKGALKSRSPLDGAQRVFAALSLMGADDFRTFASKPERLADLEYFPTGDLQNAVWDAFVERWLKVEPDAAMQTMFRAAEQLNKQHLVGGGELLDAMARVNPEAVLAALSEKNPAASYAIQEAVRAGFEALAQRDPARARRYLGAYPAEFRSWAEVAVARGIARSDPAAGALLAADLKSGEVFQTALESAEDIGPGMVREVVEAASGKIRFDQTNSPFVLAHPEMPWANGSDKPASQAGSSIGPELLRAAGRLTPEQRSRILANPGNLPGAIRLDLMLATLHAWAADEPQKALEWALAHPSPVPQGETKYLPVIWTANAWLRSDPVAACEWLSRQPSSQWRDDCLSNAAALIAASGNVQEAIALFRPTAGPNAAVNITQIALAQSKADPATAAAWLQGLPAQAETGPATTQVLESWIQKDPEAAASWVEALPPGARHDQAMSSFAQAAAGHDPVAAGAWAVSIGDPAQRRAAAAIVFQKMDQSNPAGARAWLQSLPDADAEWRDRFARLPQ